MKRVTLCSKKGFTLVELIITIAVMSVLVGVGAATIIPYMERNRVSNDQARMNKMHSKLVDLVETQGITTVLDQFWNAMHDSSGNWRNTSRLDRYWKGLTGQGGNALNTSLENYASEGGSMEDDTPPYGGYEFLEFWNDQVKRMGATWAPSLWEPGQPYYEMAKAGGLDPDLLADDQLHDNVFESSIYQNTVGNAQKRMSVKIDLCKDNIYGGISRSGSTTYGVQSYLDSTHPTRDTLDYSKTDIVLYAWQYKWWQGLGAGSANVSESNAKNLKSSQQIASESFYFGSDGHEDMNELYD